MSKVNKDREIIIKGLGEIGGILVQVASAVDTELSCPTRCTNSEWKEVRKKTIRHLQEVIPKYSMSLTLPQDEMGISAQAAIATLMKIQYAYTHIIVMLDMIRGEEFREVYLDSLIDISKKVNEAMLTFHSSMLSYDATQQSLKSGLEIIKKLERQIDEENIIICRQISVATGGDSGFISYIMRKIVGELEHISDYLEDCMEIIEDL
ncbi:MAG: hypothetical protein BAJATHORv1_30087 [Candidatus Thorarchaeota archaeon]|nr:MAG: hypothetical protein BAJATHORv1_30087 [Candidatus Thorarchaeota archaeon]